ncbi:hypothetical protein PPACK8108_LOCUS18163 [Phakopsora pachyrhizi]|uniref:Uncharacterized protein n=1 Tax=Phakopsora pachyrhizi TaxID=170000 RepID=A0AAV0BE31_PHAPC|nr:hypothetical protein PPACK8108_LOCUS18163 [Phakopsora pachyrhizi]
MSSWSSWLLGRGLSSGTQQDKKKEDHLNKKIDDKLKKAKANATTNKRAATAARRQKKLYEQELDHLAVNATMESIREQMDLTDKISNAILNPVGMGQELDEDEMCKEVWTKDKTGADDDDDENENGVYEALRPERSPVLGLSLENPILICRRMSASRLQINIRKKDHKAAIAMKVAELPLGMYIHRIYLIHYNELTEQTAFLCWVPGRSQNIEQHVVCLSKDALVATRLVLGLEEVDLYFRLQNVTIVLHRRSLVGLLWRGIGGFARGESNQDKGLLGKDYFDKDKDINGSDSGA